LQGDRVLEDQFARTYVHIPEGIRKAPTLVGLYFLFTHDGGVHFTNSISVMIIFLSGGLVDDSIVIIGHIAFVFFHGSL
jgi:hypothetical protein